MDGGRGAPRGRWVIVALRRLAQEKDRRRIPRSGIIDLAPPSLRAVSRRLRVDSVSIPMRIRLDSDSIPIRFRFESDSIPIRLRLRFESESIRVRLGFDPDSISIRGVRQGSGVMQIGPCSLLALPRPSFPPPCRPLLRVPRTPSSLSPCDCGSL